MKNHLFRNVFLGTIGISAAGLAVLFLESHRELHTFRVKKYQLSLPGRPKGRILFVTDYHEAVKGKNNDGMHDIGKIVVPDAILVGGDMVNGKDADEDYSPAASLINGLCEIAPVYYAYGNHEKRMIEWSVEDGYHWEDYINSLDPRVHFLINDSTVVSLKDGSVRLYGFDMERTYFRRGGEALNVDVIRSKLGEPKKDLPTLLLAHDPSWGPVYGEWGADLTLSGHYHGGVIRLPLIGGFISPKLHLFPHFDRGYFEENTTKMLVSSGLGQHTIPVRFYNLPELVAVDLV